MIARVTKGHGFADLARYLENGHDDANHSDRVAWTDARNLPTDDPHTAGLLMRATAAQSAHTEKPVYHIALSFNPEDAVDRATMVQVRSRDVWQMVPGEIVTVLVRKRWTYAGREYLAGDVVDQRLDVAALGLVPLPLKCHERVPRHADGSGTD